MSQHQAIAFPVSLQEYVFIIHANDVGLIGKAFVLPTNKYIFL